MADTNYDREKDIANLMRQDPELTRSEAEAQVDQNSALNSNLTKQFSGGFEGINLNDLQNKMQEVIKRSGVKTLKNTGDNAKIEREATEGSVIGVTINETKGGFKSLTASTKEGETVTIEPSLALMTDEVPGITVKKTSGKKTQITTLTGKPAADGALNMVVTQGSPKGIEKALTLSLGVTADQIKTAIRETSSNGEVAEKNINVNISTKVTDKVKTVSSASTEALSNPFGSAGSPFGAVGNPFGNLLGAISGVVSGAIKKGSTQLSDKIVEVNIQDESRSEQTNFSLNLSNIREVVGKIGTDGLPALTSLSEAIPPIITSTGTTNIGKSLTDNTLPFSVGGTSVVVNVKDVASGKNWKGGLTYINHPTYKSFLSASGFSVDKTPYDFSIINSYEELETELASVERPLTSCMVWCTMNPLNHKGDDADDLHVEQTVLQWGVLKKSKTELERYGGINAHYVILKDGSLQRGAPLNSKTLLNRNNCISLVFAGGVNSTYPYPTGTKKSDHFSAESYTPEQWKTFDEFCKRFYKIRPGGQIFGYNNRVSVEANLGKAPFFDVIEYVKSKFNKDSLYIGDNSLPNRIKNFGDIDTCFSPDEVPNTSPPIVIKPTSSTLRAKPVSPPKAEEVADATTGEVPQKSVAEKTDLQKEYETLKKEIDKLSATKAETLKQINQITSNFDLNTKLTSSVSGIFGVTLSPPTNPDDENKTALEAEFASLESQIDEKRDRMLEIEKELGKGFDRTKETEKEYNEAQANLTTKQNKLNSTTDERRQELYQAEVSQATAEFQSAKNRFKDALIADKRNLENITRII
jgi:hypothetical protein